MKLADIAEALGKSKSNVANMLRKTGRGVDPEACDRLLCTDENSESDER